MRERLNENPAAQVALIALLVAAVAFLFLRPSGGEEEAESAAPEAAVSVPSGEEAPVEAVEGAVGSASTATAAVPPPTPLPAPVAAAYRSGDSVVLLFVHDGGIDDKMVERAAGALESDPDVSLFVVPAKQVARYAAVTVGVEVNRVPALVVVRPRHLSGGQPEATVDYGYQTPEGVRQAVKDASYKGPEATYHPE